MMLERLSQREQQTVAIGLLALLVIIVYFALVEPIMATYEDYDERFALLQDRLSDYQKIAGHSEGLQQQFNQLKKQADKEQAG